MTDTANRMRNLLEPQAMTTEPKIPPTSSPKNICLYTYI